MYSSIANLLTTSYPLPEDVRALCFFIAQIPGAGKKNLETENCEGIGG